MDKIKLRITVVTALAVFLLKGTDTFAQQTDPTLTGAVFAQTSTLKNIYDKRQNAYSGGYPFSISGDIRSVPS